MCKQPTLFYAGGVTIDIIRYGTELEAYYMQASKVSKLMCTPVLKMWYSGTCVNGHLRRAVTLHKAVSTESPNGIFHALHTH